MKIARGTLLPFAVTGLLGLALSGCAAQDGGGAAAEKTPADPRAALTASVTELKKGNHAFQVVTPDAKQVGSVHLPSKSADMSMVSTGEVEMKIEIRMLEPDRWMKMTMDLASLGLTDSGSGNPQADKMLNQMKEMYSGKSWMHVDSSKLPKAAAAGLGLDGDAGKLTGAPMLIGAVTEVQGDAKTLTGTIDATKITESGGVVEIDDIKDMGPEAAKLPFTASLDDQGRLSTLEVTVPKVNETPAGKWTMTFTGYDAQKPTVKPTGAIREMPAQAYDMIGG